MKNLYLIGGAIGVGKTSASQILKKRLNNSVFLDGDWCWDSNPAQDNDETKAIVIDNIQYILNNFIKSSSYENIIFCWIMHEQETIDTILSKLKTENCNVHCISLICRPDSLASRLNLDIQNGIRELGIINKSLSYLPLYKKLNTEKIDVSEISAEEVADIIAKM